MVLLLVGITRHSSRPGFNPLASVECGRGWLTASVAGSEGQWNLQRSSSSLQLVRRDADGWVSEPLADGWRTTILPSWAQLRDWHLVSPNDTSLKRWWSNPCQRDEESARTNAFLLDEELTTPINHNLSFTSVVSSIYRFSSSETCRQFNKPLRSFVKPSF